MPRRLAYVTAFILGCGSDVDLGGSVDASPADVAIHDAVAADAQPCGVLNPPSAPSQCAACDRASPSCQPNGCFNGYYCNTATRDCHTPPTVCDDAGGK